MISKFLPHPVRLQRWDLHFIYTPNPKRKQTNSSHTRLDSLQFFKKSTPPPYLPSVAILHWPLGSSIYLQLRKLAYSILIKKNKVL